MSAAAGIVFPAALCAQPATSGGPVLVASTALRSPCAPSAVGAAIASASAAATRDVTAATRTAPQCVSTVVASAAWPHHGPPARAANDAIRYGS